MVILKPLTILSKLILTPQKKPLKLQESIGKSLIQTLLTFANLKVNFDPI